jgi:large subunit ribosomal protein L13
MKTFSARPVDIKRATHVIDAADQTLGRLSIQIARLLMGKTKPIYTPTIDTGDFVIVINAAKVRVTGKKAEQKVYYRHSNYPGGFKSITLGKMMEKFPTRAIEYAVKGMLPHTRLGAQMNKKLRVYAGATYPNAPKPKVDKPKTAKPKPEKPRTEKPKVEQPKTEQPEQEKEAK